MTGRKECKGLELSTLSKFLLLILPLVVAVLALCIGRLGISPAEVIRSIFGKITGNADLESKNELVLWNIRMPRIILAALVGAGLSVSGCTFQSLFSNPLATPDTVGVSSGTCFGAAVAIFFGADFIVTQAVAFLFGIIAVLLTYLAGSGKGKSLNSVVLAGIMIGSLFFGTCLVYKIGGGRKFRASGNNLLAYGQLCGRRLSLAYARRAGNACRNGCFVCYKMAA